MRSWLRRFVARLGGTDALPADFDAALTSEERVLAVARAQEGPLVATHLGLWLPDSAGLRRVGWHLLSKATWRDDAITVIEAEQTGSAGEAVLLRDLSPRRFALSEPGRLPEVVHERITGSIRSSHHRGLGSGGAWFVQRKVPGRDGIVLQVRPDPNTDEASLADFARELAERLRQARKPDR